VIGQLFGGRFRIRSLLGSGAFGTVYAAQDERSGEAVALKHLTRISGANIYRFKHEFRAIAELRHKNLARLHELFSDGDTWFFSMELIAGVPFDVFVRGQRVHGDELTATAPLTATAAHAPRNERGATPTELARLRPALVQLVEGVAKLHTMGVVHRDLKPGNVMVADDGRVVVLDFGLATETDLDAQQSNLGVVMGTPMYMAPEQALGKAVTPAADWYALGVMLFEVLHGRAPFEGTGNDIMGQKLSGTSRALSKAHSAAPELDALCRALLVPDPAQRPQAAAILETLYWAGATDSGQAPAPAPRSPFVGRGPELVALRQAFDAAVEGKAIAVRVRGRSGVGKSALLDAFTQSLGPDVVVLRGRCYERESVPYKALDGVVDAVTRHLGRLSPAEAALLVPREAAALCRLFPVFTRLELIADQPSWKRSSSPHEERRRGFAALRELLDRLSDRRPVVMVIDDVQWGDPDSVEPLRGLFAPPAPPRMLVLLAYRREDEGRSETLAQLLAAPVIDASSDVRTVDVEPLSEDEASQVAEALLPEGDRHRARALARESGGLPLFLPELVLAHQSTSDGSAPISLDSMLRARAKGLDPRAGRLLTAIAVAGRPLKRSDACRAAGLEGDAPSVVDVLVRERLVRQAAGDGAPLEAFHDKVREILVASLSPEALKAQHAALAEVLALAPAAEQDAEALATHYRMAGDLARARPAAVLAAERATAAFAFERAVGLYATARQGAPDDEHRSLTVRLADVLAYAGKNVEAAREYLAAAQGAPSARARDLRRRATELFFRAGLVDEASALAQELTHELGVPWQKSPGAVIASVLTQKVLLGLRGYDFVERAGPFDDTETARVDLLWSLGSGLSAIDLTRAADYQARNLRASLALGEPYRVARAFAMEGLQQSILGGKTRANGERLAQRSAELATRIDEPHAMAWSTTSLAVSDFVAGRWRSAARRFEEGVETIRHRNPEAAWQLAVAEIWFKNRSYYYLGELQTFCAEAERATLAAEERGDRLTLLAGRSSGTAYVQLIRDQPEAALESCTVGVKGWTQGEAWHVQHAESVRGQLLCHLYLGDSARAMALLEETWPRLKGSLLLRSELARYLNFSTFLAASVGAKNLEWTRRWHGEFKKQTFPICRVWATVADAGLLAVQGAPGAAEAYERAAVALDTLEMSLFAAAARRRRGELLGGAQGAALVQATDALLAQRGVRAPGRFARLLIA
jgi:hypothetical protein